MYLLRFMVYQLLFKEIDSASNVQILDQAVNCSFYAIALTKNMNPSHLLAMVI